ncbi:MAG: aminotransferase class I/II-fold pyridoxal phosphate-dependent enzyme [Cyanobacteria bacterium K_DeepCast_150m_m2_101]|nr:aminotransferase class I/II-fold pyridoxal phosphate-dependent enzyme [Cyanobacteria bacterium K_DeepCast_0m_m1_088]MBM5819899.1 aminotransferase class I/II-fold pyridoxal phosphate-dependent enzyme [Cyanobacteria bacterium K_DeepCast_150m_m2_101]
MNQHGGNLAAAAAALGVRTGQLLDASASLAPLRPAVAAEAWRAGAGLAGLRPYPDRAHSALRVAIAGVHGLDPAWVLPGNGAAELFTWAARDAAAAGVSALPAPGFADYGRALDCWGGAAVGWPLPLDWDGAFPQSLPAPPPQARALWITNPHNPTGQLWSRACIEPLLVGGALVIVDEAFLPLVPGGDAQSLIPLLAEHPNLVVIRSLTKLYGLAGLRLGYALAEPERLARWACWRDPWPVNGLAVALGQRLLRSPARYQRHCAWVQAWCAREGAWLAQRLAALRGPWGALMPLPSAANYLLLRGEGSLVPLRESLEQQYRIVLRDCRSFDGLDERWLRIGLQSRRGNRRLLQALNNLSESS